MKYINFKRYKFSTIFKNLNIKRDYFSKFFKFIDLKFYYRNYILKLFKYFISRLNLNIDISFLKNKYFLIHFPLFIIFFGFLYLMIPTFYNYEKSKIEKVICKDYNFTCEIRGEASYRFYPTPRIVVNDLVVKDPGNKKNILIDSKYVAIKLSIKNLLAKEKHKFKEININEFEFYFNLKELENYKRTFLRKLYFIPANFKKGKIIFLDGNDYIATIDNAKINFEFNKDDSLASILSGKFLDDDLYISFDKDKDSIDAIIKMMNNNLLVKLNFISSDDKKNILKGNSLIKKDKTRLTSVFEYQDNKIIIKNSNLKNMFMEGRLQGIIKILPFFDFDLELDLNNINFTKLNSYFLSLSAQEQKDFFNVNNKINGKLNLSATKVYSSYNLIKSFESRIKLNNGSILIQQLLFSMGKLGAGDIVGAINNDQKINKFKYEGNIFVDNQKKFQNKFGIYNKSTISDSFFVSGNFDLKNIRNNFYEISNKKKLSNEDVNFIEKEFNDILLSDGYNYLFAFPKFKEFLKSVAVETE